MDRNKRWDYILFRYIIGIIEFTSPLDTVLTVSLSDGRETKR